MIDLTKLHAEHKEWALHNFPNETPYNQLLGMFEEFGELCHAVLKRRQGIRGSQEEHIAEERDAVGDFWIYAFHFLTLTGITIQDVHRCTVVTAPYNHTEVGIARELGRLADDFDIKDTVTYRGHFAQLWLIFERHCFANQWSLEEVIDETWQTVKKRNWQKNKATGVASDLEEETRG